ncbi:M50 family metallopeptidase [Aristaeella lactis]|uniref:Regulator of sigma E protease n=1 Tax=Aristaeella lactis TaxID=3046383 RepID=A0AC61PN32_9FIRM|nr:M50 family metallopeptidase [Aristaeella lactis]QUA52800.1 site-2 protease family protein [Aristaeella lactis]SMC73686.1 regulator of sigma E protease [Aristaeella lactis]
MYIILALLLLAILITVHEFGHFLAARAMKIEVREFAIGMGPKLIGWKSKKYDTDFSIRAIPLGGFCAFYGEDDAKGISKDDPRAFPKQNVWKRLFVILMGPVMNFVLAFVVGTVFFWVNGVETITGIDPYIVDVMAAGPAYSAGIQAKDVVTEINGVNMLDGTETTLLDTIGNWKEGDAPLKMTILRGEETVETELTPVWDEKEQKMRIGVTIGGKYRTETEPETFLGGIKDSWDWCSYASGVMLRALKDLVTTGEGLDQTSGPVGIVSMVSTEVQEEGLRAFIRLLMVISINLGLMNLLPIPGLDGSRLVFGLVEVVRRKPVPPEKEAMVHLAGMVVLFGFMIFITFKDIMKLFG